jgi:adenine deaminase
MKALTISGNIVDIHHEEVFKGTVYVENGLIRDIVKDDSVQGERYILPGLIDSHIHVESSMLIPSEFARAAVIHGTVATVSDPHEIANVLGIEGVKYMIRNGRQVPFKFYFGASSCVPATPFETAGAELGVEELNELMAMDEIKYMAEMMNFPGVINGDPLVTAKLDIAKKYNKPVDGHAPGVKGENARKYAGAGITTDHECFTMEEALDKIKYGMKIQIREGSAAKNFEALADLLKDHADKVLFCSDDKHPDDLVEGHINQLVKRAVAKGYDPLKVLKSVILNPVEHYKLEMGTLRPGDPADMIVVDDLANFNVLETYIDGVKVAENGRTLIESVEAEEPNKFFASKVAVDDLKVTPESENLKVIKAFDGELITGVEVAKPLVENGNVVSNVKEDILKLVVLNRYEQNARPAVAFIKGFGIKKGAIASSVAHDSHNVIAVGTGDEEIVKAMNLVIASKGGVAVVNGDEEKVLALPVAGLMSTKNAFKVAEEYHRIDQMAHDLGSDLRAPFMTLSFMALLVIPELKLSDKGLFDGIRFGFTDVFVKS